MRLRLQVVEGVEEMPCVVQVSLRNRRGGKKALILILLKDECVDMILEKPS